VITRVGVITAGDDERRNWRTATAAITAAPPTAWVMVSLVLRPRVEVEETETAPEIAALGIADTVTWHGVLHRLGDRLPGDLGRVPLRPRLYETFAIVHRHGTRLSAASRVVVELAAARMRRLDAAIGDATPGGTV
jgi:hypothetical protein